MKQFIWLASAAAGLLPLGSLALTEVYSAIDPTQETLVDAVQPADIVLYPEVDRAPAIPATERAETPAPAKGRTSTPKPTGLKVRVEKLEKQLAVLQERLPESEPMDLKSAPGFEYDQVPPDQVGRISGRLRLIEELLVKHGRAYDYRSHTTRELELILSRLKRAGQPKLRENQGRASTD